MSAPQPGDPADRPPHPRRRSLFGWLGLGARAVLGGALAGRWSALPAQTRDDPAGNPSAAAAAEAASGAVPMPPVDPGRLALVIGNRRYPGDFELPSIHKNARDVEQALRWRGFGVSLVLDAEPGAARSAVDAFVARAAAAPEDATVLFYFSGHGLQLNAENLLLAAGVPPKAPPASLQSGSLVLNRDVVARLPRRRQGLTIAIVDACRSEVGTGRNSDAMNQEEPPLGCLIAFSTGAGQYALAPTDENINTFYTRELVRLLRSEPDELPLPLLFEAVKRETERAMRARLTAPHLARFVQRPFVAKNVPDENAFPLAPRSARSGPPKPPPPTRAEEDADWAALQAALWPPDVLRLAGQFLQRHPEAERSRRLGAEVAQDGARQAAELLRRPDLLLNRGAFAADASRGEAYATDVRKAGRGDKDAAARVGRQWATAERLGPARSRYEGWMQLAAELGNGIASYELARHFRRQDQPQAAARWEARAIELGYTPPPTLDHYRK
ncbi:caspase family protein [Ideonella sp. DXS22W]|uniref:Caspase family protein n=1 Tax=Pseudaquabacterium inlustre TaxID=2984192 RepID=A0ABU9CF69_9BURK